ncbi:MAG TPA: DUF899 family protein [Candidatus Angelobacter sp.]|nr:DUF899 family protein [Candidatus Angelobacter sp.]
MATTLHSIRFPGETDSYRAARNELLEAEIRLRRNIEEVAALRRKLAQGGEVPEDYVFDEGSSDPVHLNDVQNHRKTRMSELFAPGKDTLVVYSYMHGPNMKTPCTSCTSILDGLNGTSPHLNDRINFVVVAKSPIQRLRATAAERGWNNLRLLSSENNTYNRDYQGENSNGDQQPSLNVFVRREGKIHHFYNTELLFAPKDPGQDGRHVDLLWPLWNVFDFTPEGRGTNWRPKLAYGQDRGVSVK